MQEIIRVQWFHRFLTTLFACLPLIYSVVMETYGQSYFYDDAGRLVQVAYPQGSGIRYGYDDADNLLRVQAIALPAAPRDLVVERVSLPCNQLTWRDSASGETGFTIMRRLRTDYLWEEIATVGPNETTFMDCNVDSAESYVYRVAALSAQGLSAYTPELGPNDSTLAEFSLTDGSAQTTITADADGPAMAGYATVDVHYGQTPYGTAVFAVSQNGAVVSEAGVPASPPTTGVRIFVDYRNNVEGDHFTGRLQINTGFAVVNRGLSVANITYVLRDVTGTELARGNGSLNTGGHFARFVDQIPELAPGFVLPPDFPNSIGFGSLDILSDQPLSILALRLTVNQRGEALLTSTPSADLDQSVDNTGPLYFPQFADGGGFVSSIVLVNTSAATQTGAIQVYGDDGFALPVEPVDGPVSSSFPYAIPPAGVFVLQTRGAGASPVTGWAVVTPGGGSTTPVGSGLFQLAQAGTVVTESGVPPALPTTQARIYIDLSGGHNTGLALANPGANDISIVPNAFELDGATSIGSSPQALSLDGWGHSARFVDQFVSGLPAGFTGVLDITSQLPFVALTLRSLTNIRSDFLITAFPIADSNRAAPSPIVFPQIADGGGISTQFILLSGRGASGATLRFFDGAGIPAFIGRADRR